ncbi:hypothetical protein [Streptomyces antibioticus]|uniref:hypothetical protein n=1 Tax=Streptomyces antibioticus TaxID=1890 RepID=UPI00340C22B3
MRLVSAAKYAALQTLQQRTAAALERAEKLAAERQATITRQAAELARLRDAHPDTPLPQPLGVQGDAELRRQLDLARRTIRQLDERVVELQRSHVADTRELHDLRQNGGVS